MSDATMNRGQFALTPLQAGFRLILSLILILLFCSCSAPVLSTAPGPKDGDFTLFLQPLPQETHRLNFTIGELTARRADGTEIPLSPRQSIIPTDRPPTEQVKLASVTLPPGRYLGLRLRIKTATLSGEEGEISLLPPTEPILVEYPFTIQKKQLQALFLSLSADRVVTDGAFFTPKFSLWKPRKTLSNLKGFVSNSGADSLTVFNKRSAEVIGAIRVGAGPMDLALDQRNGYLYVAVSRENTIAVVDINTDAIIGQVRLRSGDEPTELALSTSGKRLLVLNRGSSSVSIIDTDSLSERGRIKLDSTADDVLMGPDENIGYVIHSSASVISALDLDSLYVRTSSIFGDVLLRGAISPDGQTLFVVTDFSATLLVVDVGSLTVHKKIDVGNSTRAIKLDDATGLLYIGKKNGEIAVADPRVLMAIESFSLPGPAQALTIDREENSLFAVLPQSRRLLKLDLLSKRQTGILELGDHSHAVVVMLER